VEQLRAHAADVPIALALDAAAEIERLRSALQKLAHPGWGEYRSDEQIVQGGKSSPRCAEGAAMTEKEGTLRMMASGRWAIYRPGRLPVEIMSGDLFRIEVAGAKELKLTRMEYDLIDRQYYSIDDYPLRDGLRATIGEGG